MNVPLWAVHLVCCAFLSWAAHVGHVAAQNTFDNIDVVGFGMRPGADNHVYAFLHWDSDGDGPNTPNLYAAGRFLRMGGVPSNKVARWDGDRWRSLGDGLTTTTDTRAYAMTAWDPDGDGPLSERLYVCGNLPTSAGSPGAHVASWDGANWSALGDGLNGVAIAMTVWDPDGSGPAQSRLVVGGSFTLAGGAAASRVATWDGAAWSAMGSGLSSNVLSLDVWDPDGEGPEPGYLVAGGDFTVGTFPDSSRVARWNGAAWIPLGRLEGTVADFQVFDRDGDGPMEAELFAAGTIYSSGGSVVRGVVLLEGNAWVSTGFVAPGGISLNSLWIWDSDGEGALPGALVAGGQSSQAPYVWTGTSWSPLNLLTSDPMRAGITHDPDGPGPASPIMVVASDSEYLAGSQMNHVAIRDGDAWRPFGDGWAAPSLNAVYWRSESQTPTFWTSFAARLYAWGSTGWEERLNLYPLFITPLIAADPDEAGPVEESLVLRGNLTSLGVTSQGIAWWDGTAFGSFGAGISSTSGGGSIDNAMLWDPDADGPLGTELVIEGDFNRADGKSAIRIARWNGVEWNTFGAGGANGWVEDMTEWDIDGSGPALPRLVMCGTIASFAGLTGTRCLGLWDGTGWEQVGSGVSACLGMTVTSWDPDGTGPDDPLLIIGGQTLALNDLPGEKLAAWDGVSFSAVGPTSLPTIGRVRSWDPDGSGPRPPLLCVLHGTTSGGPSLLRGWDGVEWTTLATIYGGVTKLDIVDFDDGGPIPAYLLATGGIGLVNDVASSGMFLLRPEGPPVIVANPQSAEVCTTESVHMAVRTDLAASHVYQWERRDGGEWTDLENGLTPGGSTISGADTSELTLSNSVESDTGEYRCMVSNDIGLTESAIATLVTQVCCPADYNDNFEVDILDFLDFFEDFSNCDAQSAPCGMYGDADRNGDTLVDILDLLEFLDAFGNGC